MVEVAVQCNLLDNQYQQKPDVLYTFSPNNSYAYFLYLEPRNLVCLERYNTEFNYIVITLWIQMTDH